ncbi:Papilin [Orchesella cincta]|uniref:Papilin n=1 Tax=Orchesella cincta TaxID=48709 RepID=A0A1D2N8G4_ORCCI|nr:Papilin [Orchesella cincta]
MATNSKSENIQQSLKPLFLFMVAAILLSKSQRVLSQNESSEPNESTTTDTSVICPDYCNLASDRGGTRGKAPFGMWYYDVSDGDCKRFRWTGRGGNKNRFRKRADCEETCSKCALNDILDEGSTQDPQFSESVKDLICNLPLDEGKCNQSESEPTLARQPQLAWYFDTDKETCAPFVFFGCEGNNNRFINRKECEEVCVQSNDSSD